MTAIIAYGSLINLEQHRQGLHLFSDAYPVLVQGYRRVFSQEPSWRQGDRTHRAVLNVIKADKDWFNGVLIGLHDGSRFDAIDQREIGYDRVLIASSQIAPFKKLSRKISCGQDSNEQISNEQISNEQVSDAIAAQSTYIYLGKPEKQNNSILPNKDYLALCLRGAQHWGEAFYEQFLQTTYVGPRPLKSFLERIV